MKKWIFRAVALAAVLVVVLLVAVFFALNPIVRGLVESQGTAGTGVNTELNAVNLRPFGGAATLKGFSLANPEGFDGKIFELGEADVKVNTFSALSDEVVVPRVAVDGATVRVAYADGKLNVMELMKLLQSGEQAPDTPETDPEDAAPGKGFVINDLSVTNTRVLGTIALPGLSPQDIDLTIADIKKTDVRGAGMKDVINLVVETVMLNAAKGLGGVVPNLDDLVGDVEALADAKMVELEGRADAAIEGAEQKVDDAIGGVEKKLGGFLDGLGGKKEGK